MNITDVRVRKVAKEGKMKAVVSITIDEEFVVHDIKVIEGEKGLFIAMPSRKATDGEYRDIAHPINSATRDRIQTIILDKYQEVMAEEPEAEELWQNKEDYKQDSVFRMEHCPVFFASYFLCHRKLLCNVSMIPKCPPGRLFFVSKERNITYLLQKLRKSVDFFTEYVILTTRIR